MEVPSPAVATTGDLALTLDQAAAAAHISKRTIWRLINSDKIKSTKVSERRRIIFQSEMDRFLREGI